MPVYQLLFNLKIKLTGLTLKKKDFALKQKKRHFSAAFCK